MSHTQPVHVLPLGLITRTFISMGLAIEVPDLTFPSSALQGL